MSNPAIPATMVFSPSVTWQWPRNGFGKGGPGTHPSAVRISVLDSLVSVASHPPVTIHPAPVILAAARTLPVDSEWCGCQVPWVSK